MADVRIYQIPGKDYQRILGMLDELHDLFLAIEKVKTRKRLERARTLLGGDAGYASAE